ncbi:MAG: YcbK family protein [Steroidobacteraceae bacterium]
MITRRRMLAAAASSAAALPLAELSRAAARERWIELMNTHTNEVVSVAYRNEDGFVPEALARLDHVLRDHRSGEQREMDRALFDLLVDLAAAAQREPRYEIISGYRSPATNAKLAAQGSGVSARSLHIQGRAIDVRLVGFSTAELRDLALAMKRGGVGYYARPNFVHLDTGRVRRWVG